MRRKLLAKQANVGQHMPRLIACIILPMSDSVADSLHSILQYFNNKGAREEASLESGFHFSNSALFDLWQHLFEQVQVKNHDLFWSSECDKVSWPLSMRLLL